MKLYTVRLGFKPHTCFDSGIGISCTSITLIAMDEQSAIDGAFTLIAKSRIIPIACIELVYDTNAAEFVLPYYRGGNA